MTTTEKTNALRGLLQSIISEPAADDLRLIYADLLEEVGQEKHAEFIRVQIEMDGLVCTAEGSDEEIPRTPYSMYCDNSECQHCMLDHRSHILLVDELAIWKAPQWVEQSEHRRGFLWSVSATFDALQKNLPVLVKEHPVGQAWVTDKEPIFHPQTPMRKAPDHWSWWSSKARTFDRASDIPHKLWEMLEGESLTPEYPYAKDYRSLREAKDDLSRVLPAVARGEA